MFLKRFKSLILYLMVRLSFAFLRGMRRPLANSICRFIAILIWSIDSKHRSIGMKNLSIAFPQRSIRWKKMILRDSFLNLGELTVELSRIPGLERSEICKRVIYEEGYGLENYLRAKDSGKGVLFVTAHISAWELLPAAHAARGYPLSFLVRRLDNIWLDRWSRKIRCKFGNKIVDKRRSIRKVISLIRRGEDVGFLLDQNVMEHEGVYVPFFGWMASTSSSVAALAIRTGAPVVVGFICPGPKLGLFKIRFYPAFRAQEKAEMSSEVLRLTTLINQRIEEVIQEFPARWLWCHRRFQTQPDGINPYS